MECAANLFFKTQLSLSQKAIACTKPDQTRRQSLSKTCFPPAWLGAAGLKQVCSYASCCRYTGHYKTQAAAAVHGLSHAGRGG